MKHASVLLALIWACLFLPAQDYELNQTYLNGPSAQNRGKSFVINEQQSKKASFHKKVIWGTYRAQLAANTGYLLYSLDPSGQLMTSVKIPTFLPFNGLPGPDAKRIKQTTDGGYIMIGTLFSNSVLAISTFILKVDSDLNYQWSREMVSTAGGSFLGLDIIQNQGGEYLVVGRETQGQSGSDLLLAKLTPWGTIAWQKSINIGYIDYGNSLVESASGEVFITGGVQSQTAQSKQILLMKTNASGTVQWIKTLDLPFDYEGEGTFLTTSKNGIERVYFCGIAKRIDGLGEGPIQNRAAIVGSMDTNGQYEWVHQYGGEEDDLAMHIRVRQVGLNTELAVTGATNSFGIGGYDQMFFRTNSEGEVLEALTYGGKREDFAYESQQDAGHQSLIGQRGIKVTGADDQSNISVVGFTGNGYKCGNPFPLPRETLEPGDSQRWYIISTSITVSTPASVIPSAQLVSTETVCGKFLATRFSDFSSELKPVPSLTVFPNPTTGNAVQIRYEVPEDHIGPIGIKVWNSLGQAIASPQLEFPHSAGVHEVKLPLGEGAAGLYRISLTIGKETHSQEVVKR
ncbi:MAG: T9SS type A sorting domain-containing protein [Bacteroidota bacterium]